jgi:hypothetical protein
MHAMLWARNIELYCNSLLCDLVRHFWLEIMTVLFEEQSDLCSELYHNDEKQEADIHTLNLHFNWNWATVQYALPQDSILGHMLFLTYIQLSVQSQCLYTNCLIHHLAEYFVSQQSNKFQDCNNGAFLQFNKGFEVKYTSH